MSAARATVSEQAAIAVVTVVIGQPPRIRIRYAEPGSRWTEHVHAAPEPAMAELWAWCEEAFRVGQSAATPDP